MPHFTENIKVEIRGRKYKFSLRTNTKCKEEAHAIADNACGGITYRIDVRRKKKEE